MERYMQGRPFRVFTLTSTGRGPGVASLMELMESRVRQAARGRIRDLVVREDGGRILLQGQARTQYARQLALCEALQFVSGE
ncbi:hypothetical protein OJF2_53090 [Aquisphaera giovannonii]|uniref:Uncharacterized protein n=1 Tax=Aquisphaera giovannonii TaxID=406548 RepID=A0A5B9W8W6_9BACT|nr:hypothetical protein OJF2_53090 [Aquisphaera giovannonii]